MKAKNIIKIVAAFLFVGIFTACVQDDDYSVPTFVEKEPTIAENGHEYTFNALMTMYADNFYNVVDFDTEVPDPANGADPNVMEYSYLVGYVISNDRTGNFYKSIYIQDAIENPTIGFKIDVDMYDTYIKYDVGRKVYVKLNGLGFEQVNGVYSLGALNGTSLERIPELDVPNHVLRSTEVNTIVPRQATAAAINAGSLPDGILVEIPNMQVPFSDLGLSYANLDNTYSVNRTLKSCDDGEELIIRNSGFADFRTVPMPQGAGTLTAVLSRYNSTKQLFISDTNDLDFTGDRCDPLLAESFSNPNGQDVDREGWINYAEAGTRLWSEGEYQGNGFADFSAYGTNEASNIAWMISPAVNFDAQGGEILTFETQHAYPDAGHDAIEVFVSTDFDGTEAGILTATWTSLDFTSSLEADFGNWYTWTDSGDIDLSSYTGTGYIAFKYTGSDTGNMNTTIRVDNIELN